MAPFKTSVCAKGSDWLRVVKGIERFKLDPDKTYRISGTMTFEHYTILKQALADKSCKSDIWV